MILSAKSVLFKKQVNVKILLLAPNIIFFQVAYQHDPTSKKNLKFFSKFNNLDKF